MRRLQKPATRTAVRVTSDDRNRAELDYVPFPAGKAVHLAAMNFVEDAWVTRDGVYYLERRDNTPLAPVALSSAPMTGP